ncbi:hypothetical protein [Herbidospora mongoliensis]|uniref:hypothetical protein n=1 Tax=Herbidospora mongoliensis TaxID=688067 RepID=UPI000ADB7F8F|nr:hypothetical protein [Herbidospora mongoliensis]
MNRSTADTSAAPARLTTRTRLTTFTQGFTRAMLGRARALRKSPRGPAGPGERAVTDHAGAPVLIHADVPVLASEMGGC